MNGTTSAPLPLVGECAPLRACADLRSDDHAEGLESLAEELAALAADCADPNPFYGPDLFPAALVNLASARDVRMILAREADGTAIGFLPVVASARHGHFPVRHCANWMHEHAFYGAPLLARGEEERAWEAILTQLDAAPWAGPFLHIRGLDDAGAAMSALRTVAARQGRKLDTLQTFDRALLESPLSAEAYWTQTVRAKKRKELRRQQARLAEEGEVLHESLAARDDPEPWIDAFLALEAVGWKGEGGTALADSPRHTAMFRTACQQAHSAGRLHMLRIACDGRPIAMLVNFLSGDGAFSFKIAIDPAFSRFSPGVLIEQDNLAAMLDQRVAGWMDSCAAPDHPMIDSLWAERRTIGQYRIALRKTGVAGMRNRTTRVGIRTAEAIVRRAKRMRGLK